MMRWSTCTVAIAALTLAACQSGDAPENLPGSADDTQPYSGIKGDERLRFTGTEPFWGGEVAGTIMVWRTPENIEGVTIPVQPFAGRGGISYTGVLDGEELTLAITPGDCSDGMSDQTYPFVVTASVGEDLLSGCGWRDSDDLGPPP